MALLSEDLPCAPARNLDPSVLQRVFAVIGRSELARRFAADSAWAAIDSLGARGLGLLAMLLAARLLGAQDFGELAAVLGSATLVAGLLADSMRYTAATQIAGALGKERTARSGIITVVIWTTVIAASICATAMFLGAALLARNVFAASSLTIAVRVAALFLFCEALGGLEQGILVGFRQFRTLAWTGLMRGALLPPLVLIVGHHGNISVMWAFVAASALAAVIRAMAIAMTLKSQQLTAVAPIARAELAMLWRISFPGLMVSLITVPVNWLGIMLLVHTPHGYSQMGVLGAANQWFSILMFIPGVLSTVTLPLLSERYASGESESLRRALRLGLRTSLIAAAPPALVVAGASPWLMSLYGADFASGWPTLALVAAAAGTSAMLNMLLNLLGAAGRVFHVLATQALWALVYLSSAYGLLQLSFGASAIAAAMLLGSLCRLALSGYWARQLTERHIP
jgi:O-antigen/teichoic acid export membrane protein